MNRSVKFLAFLIISSFLFGTATAEAVTLYSVRPKDTLAKIARAHNVSIDCLRKANTDLRKNSTVKIGQILIIPDQEEVVEQESSTSTTIVIHNAVPMPSVARVETPRTLENHPSEAVHVSKVALTDADVIVDKPSAPQYSVMAQPTRVPAHDNIAIIDSQIVRVPTYVPPPTEEIVADSPIHHRGQLASRKGSLIVGIISVARRFMGIPYVWGGTTPRGFDCSGFVMRVFALNGIQLQRTADAQYYQGSPVKDPNPGDLVFFSTYLPGPSHVGIYLGGNQFIQASSRRGVIVSSLTDSYYARTYIGARRYF